MSVLENSRLISRVAVAGVMHPLRPKIRQLILHVTKRCNFRCRHCFVDFSDIPKDLTLAEIADVAETVGPLIWLDIGGGEPFLRQDLVEAIELFEFEELSIPTNGWFTEQTVAAAKKLANRFGPKLSIALSVDGSRDTHDEIRKQPGSFDRLMATFAELRKIPHLRLVFLSTLCERNAGELLDLIKSLQEHGPDYHAVNILRGSPIDPTYRLDTEDVRRFWAALEVHYRTHGYSRRSGLASVPFNYIRLRWSVAIRTLEERRQVVPCLGGTATLVIHPNGDVGPCETLPPVASIKRQPLADIMKSVEWHRTVRSIQAKECYCTHECNMKSSIFLKPTLYPLLVLGR